MHRWPDDLRCQYFAVFEGAMEGYSIVGEDGGSGGGGGSKFGLFGRWLRDMGAYFSGSSKGTQVPLLGAMCAIHWGAWS